MGRKSSKAEVEHRVNMVQRLIYNGCNTSDIRRFAAQEWGTAARTTDVYIKRARERVVEDYALERKDYIASRLGILDKVIKESIKAGQYNNTIGALRLAAELTGSFPDK